MLRLVIFRLHNAPGVAGIVDPGRREIANRTGVIPRLRDYSGGLI